MNPSLALATVVVDELIRHGVRDVVLAPGSRSAPLAYAVDAAAREGRLRLHVRVDERSAGYLALGMAKVTRVPVPVITTSGTAVANLHPSVLEAAHASVPMLLLTADRPPDLRGVGANQATDQVGVFGGATRWFHEFGVPERRVGQNGMWRSIVGRAVAESTGMPAGDAGPVHLNVPLREPLVPTEDEPEWPESLDGRPRGETWLSLRNPLSHKQSVVSGPVIAPVPRTLVVLGDLPDPAQAAQLSALADAAGWPVMAEPFGQYHRGRATPHGALILRAEDWLAAHLPERVLVGGRLTLDRRVAALLRHPDVEVEIVTPGTSWPDPGHVVSRVHRWEDIERSHTAVSSCVDRAWGAAWRTAGGVIGRAVGPVVEASWPSGPAVARTIAHAMPENSGLYVGPSNAVRDLDLSRDPHLIAKGVVSVGNRGLAGIDGVVSSAIGMALSRPGAPAYALMGDLTFLHDVNGLLVGEGETRPDLTIVLVNDDGGGIFGTLEPGQKGLSEPFERIFGTPTGVDFEQVCAARGVPYELVGDQATLKERIANPGKGIRVLEVKVPRTGQRELLELMGRTAADALKDSA
ncbi:2-succinyl-5-enolpyruvyl-6-hydroxy-3-cyclohexene-1-carboxylic-acid synthase [Calidifontibacter sp. DB0510]|uniref:2-succinyl-5-enolpyruvyl-6-hydroxy-3-cyclohexene-1-carboxylate synthase n=1 Tax=Metallococcus carri TaxID=1656884 RepID=A0A967AZI2_9MICO|nr:2-succinyl-5-enolpyruvyl-6-hydroxy-3-cyclohexene-1-carboxylic-acid synthase [Metallococcus carri]NHN55282.1 2-succinyl-5-enolpyruvyl-6-hydroxy-3-cyclohexene-1-carboxylic-acid synthase [Metallococcus carri]NOP36359.1 2-succinyl-5-enolpyruvyl-6-hydroxy-3-cyclohexene-1-carboxylic-acid synthase [Calidifontibacter sp. DB2511S]